MLKLLRLLRSEWSRRDDAGTALNQSERERLLSFLGYGNPYSSVWFVGLEEGLGGAMTATEELANLRARSRWKPVMDLRKAHLTLSERGQRIDIAQPRAGSTAVWMWMARVCLSMGGWQYSKKDKEVVHRYVRTKLGRAGCASFMTELSPVPCGGTGKRSPLHEYLRSPEAAALLDQRRSHLRSMLEEARPQAVICYGLSAAERYSEFLDVEWKCVDGSWPRGQVRKDRNSNTFLLPFFGVGQMSHATMESFLHCSAFQDCVRRRR